jgi:MoaA/NifB/PqqE/SkfB family radical SAM enzyme
VGRSFPTEANGFSRIDLSPDTLEKSASNLPLDHPSPQRPHRVYAALTNHCNRSCPWCSTCSSPHGRTWLTIDDFSQGLPESGIFEVQLEGGEPTLHPGFWSFVNDCRDNVRCSRLVLCTNGTVLPRTRRDLRKYAERLGKPLTIKLSINHYLLEHDPGLITLAADLLDVLRELGDDRLLVINVRLRKSISDIDRWIVDSVRAANLLEHANVFYLQRYGYASDQMDWDPPFLVAHNFRMINPDGTVVIGDLIARAEGMRKLP